MAKKVLKISEPISHEEIYTIEAHSSQLNDNRQQREDSKKNKPVATDDDQPKKSKFDKCTTALCFPIRAVQRCLGNIEKKISNRIKSCIERIGSTERCARKHYFAWALFAFLICAISPLSIGMITVGIMYINSCPTRQEIPIWLIVTGFYTIYMILLHIFNFICSCRNSKCWKCVRIFVKSVSDLCMIGLLVLGLYWVYTIYDVMIDELETPATFQSLEEGTNKSCDQVCYLFSAVVAFLLAFTFIIFYIVDTIYRLVKRSKCCASQD